MIARVHYPLVSGRMALRTELDWEKNVEAVNAGNVLVRFQSFVRIAVLLLQARHFGGGERAAMGRR
jgi:hypothetical protein